MRRVVPIALVAAFLFFATLSHGVERIVILPFESLSKDDISFIQQVVPKLLSSRLAEMTGLDTVTAEVASPDEALVTYGPSYLVSGSVTKLGSTYSLDIIVHDPSGEKVGGYFSSAQDENGILASLEGLAEDVAGVIPEAKIAGKGEEGALVAGGVPPAEGPPVQKAVEEPQVMAAEKSKAEQKRAAEPETDGKEKEVAAVMMVGKGAEPASKVGWEFTGIKVEKTLGKLPGEINRLAVGDVDGDGSVEMAFMGTFKVYIYRYKDEKFYPVTTIERGIDHHFLNIEVYDVDGDGTDDFVVTDLFSEFLRSFVIGKKGSGLGITVEGIPWYLRVFDDFKGERVLVGQKLGFESPYSDRAFIMSWDGSSLKEVEKFDVPTNVEKVMGVINMNSFMEGEEQKFVLIDQYEKIRVADDEGRIFWKSGDYYSGALDFFMIPSENIGAEGELVRYYVNGRIQRVPHENKIVFLVRKATKPLLKDLRSFSKSSIVLVEWDGDGFVEVLEGEEASNLITDFAIFEAKEGEPMIVASIIVKEESGLSRGSSRIELFTVR